MKPNKRVGRNCYDIDECQQNDPVCLHDGDCFNTVGNFTCDCMGTGYTGHTCHEDLDECQCMVDGRNRYRKLTGECRDVKLLMEIEKFLIRLKYRNLKSKSHEEYKICRKCFVQQSF